jgi:hypothetical protein
MQTLIAIILVVLMTSAPAFARKAFQHQPKRVASKHQSAVKATDRGVIERHPDDVALDRKIGSICRGC